MDSAREADSQPPQHDSMVDAAPPSTTLGNTAPTIATDRDQAEEAEIEQAQHHHHHPQQRHNASRSVAFDKDVSTSSHGGGGETALDIPNHTAAVAATTDDAASTTPTSSQEKVVVVAGDEGGPPAKPTTSPEDTRTGLQTAVIMLSLGAAVFLAALDTTIVTTALPAISEYFGSAAGYTWIGSAFLLACSASVPAWGKFSDIWGRKPVLLVAAVIFFVGSALAGAASSIGMLITARAIQGIGGGGLIILANICISDLFSMRNRGKYFGMIGGVWALASAIGPLLGGAFTEKVSWRWCFYINLPITGVVFAGLFFFLHLDNPKTPVWDGLKAVDWLGSLAVVGGTLMLLLGLEFGGITYPWSSATVICLIIFGVVTSALFVLIEWKVARYPVMPLRLFSSLSNVASFGVCFCHGFVFISGSYYLPLYFQAVIGASPLLSGVYILPYALALSFVSAATGVIIKKTGKYRPAIWFGLFFMVLGFGLFIDLPLSPGWAKLIIFQIIAGIGVGPNFQSPLLALQNGVSPRDIGVATAMFGFTRNLSSAISVVVGGVVFQNQMAKQTATLVAALGPDLAAQLSGGSAGASVGIVQGLPAAQAAVVRAAYNAALRDLWIVYVCFAALGLFVSLFICETQMSRDHTVTKTGLAEEEAKRREIQQQRRASREVARLSREMKREGGAGGNRGQVENEKVVVGKETV